MARAVSVKSTDEFGADFVLDDGTTRYMYGPEALTYASDLAAMGRVAPEAEQQATALRGALEQPDLRTAKRTTPLSPEQRADIESTGARVGPVVIGPRPDRPPVNMAGAAERLPGQMSMVPGSEVASAVSDVEAQRQAALQDAAERQAAGTPEARAAAAAQSAQDVWASDPRFQARRTYTAPFDPEKEAASRRPVPTSMTEERTGVLPAYEDVAQARELMAAEQVELARQQAQNEIELARNQASALRGARPQLLEAEQRAKVAEQEIQSQVQADMRGLEQMHQELSDTQLDTGRYFKQAGALGALSAFAGLMLYSLGGGDAMRMLSTFIDRDVAMQEQEYNIKREGADNALTLLKLKYGDLEQAKLALKMQQAKVADNFAAEMEAVATDDAARQRYAQTRAAIQSKYLDWLTEYRDRAVGNATIKVANEMQSPRAGGVAIAPPKLQGAAARKEQLEILNVERQLQGLPPLDVAQAQEFALQKAGAQREQAEAQRVDERAWQLQKEKADTQALVDTVETLANAAGAERGPDGKWRVPEGGNLAQIGRFGPLRAESLRGITPAGPFMRGGVEKGLELNQLQATVDEKYRRAQSGAAIAQGEKVDFGAQLWGAGTEAEFIRGLNTAEATAREYQQMLDAGMPPEVIERIQQNRSGQRSAAPNQPQYDTSQPE